MVSFEQGKVVIKTDLLDGETTKKRRLAVLMTQRVLEDPSRRDFFLKNYEFIVDTPSTLLDHFEGAINKIDPEDSFIVKSQPLEIVNTIW